MIKSELNESNSDDVWLESENIQVTKIEVNGIKSENILVTKIEVKIK